jgi:alpha-tubulin suppressor-like RCC1 family protein
MPTGVTFISLGVGSNHGCGLTSVGAAYCWGINSSGQLGDGTTTQGAVPTAVTMPTGVTFTSLGVGANHSCGLTAAGAYYCWGLNTQGQLGDGTTTNRGAPTAVLVP